MSYSRRDLVRVGLGLAGATLWRPFAAGAAELRFESNPFTLGVASGFPEPDAVVLWTRLAPEPLAPGGGMPASPIEVLWEIASDERFRRIERSGNLYATPDWAHSVHVEATGLTPARDYWYRFTSGGQQSPVGHTRTAPSRMDSPRALKLAVACCQHYEQGHYAAYGAIARDDVDVVVHVGDYIYEGRGTNNRVRSHAAAECHTLDDYRHRYALYKSDPLLQAAHAASPWMLTPDDHEVANDYAADRSAGPEPPELFMARRAAAYQAYYEHLPLPRRFVPFAGRQLVYTSRGFGDLVDLVMLDGRQYRSRQACGGGAVVPCAALFANERTMLGADQEAWLADTLGARRARWNLVAQQTLFAHFDQSGAEPRRYWADGWNGYPAARKRLIGTLTERRPSNPVILSGDIHAFLVNDVNLKPEDPASPIVAAELVTTSISSQGPPQAVVDSWLPENPNVHLARSDTRGYLRLNITRERLRADLIAVDNIERADSGTHVLAAFDIADGAPGIAG